MAATKIMLASLALVLVTAMAPAIADDSNNGLLGTIASGSRRVLVISCNTTLQYVRDRLVYLNTTYSPAYPTASDFLAPAIDLANFGLGSGFSSGQVLQRVVTALDKFLFALAGTIPKLPEAFKQEISNLIDKLLPCLPKASGAAQVLLAFLVAVLYLTKGLLFP